MTGAFFVIAFRIHSSLARVIVANEKHDKKKGKEWRLKNLAESIPELIPRPLILTRGFVFIIFCSVGIGKAEYISFFFFPTFHQYIYIYIIRSRFMNFHSIRRGERKKKRESMRIEQNSG